MPSQNASAAVPTGPAHGNAEVGHHDSVSEPDSGDGPLADAEAIAAQISTDAEPMGTIRRAMRPAVAVPDRDGRRRGRRRHHRPGRLVVVGLRDVLILIGLALFIAVGLEPRCPGWCDTGCPAGSRSPPCSSVAFAAVGGLPRRRDPGGGHAGDPAGREGPRLSAPGAGPQLLARPAQRALPPAAGDRAGLSAAAGASGGLLTAGVAVFSALANLGILIVLTVYFVADLPRIRAALYRLVPHSRRPRAILIGDEICTRSAATCWATW